MLIIKKYKIIYNSYLTATVQYLENSKLSTLSTIRL